MRDAIGSPRHVRVRLALVYASLFFVFGAGLLAVSYVVVRHEFGPQPGFRVLATGGPTEQRIEALPSAERVDQVFTRVLNEQNARGISQVLLWFAVALGLSTIASLGLGWLLAGRALRPLQDAYESQRHFVSHASHELRTPLAVMRASIDVTGEEGGYDDPGQVRAMVATQRKAIARSEALVDRLLALAMGDRGLDRRETVDLAPIVREALDDAAPGCRARRLTVRAEIEPAPVEGDPVLLHHLVANLVENAVRHNRDGGAIDVRVSRAVDGVTLRIGNDGAVIGCDVGELLRPFRRAATRAVANGSGYGLGLSVVDSVARAHRATVALQARDTGGLQAIVAFPPVG